MRIRLRSARIIGLLVVAGMPTVGCETSASRQAAKERNNNRAAEELRHLCRLPGGQRKVEIEKLQKKYNVTIVCPPDTSNATT